METKNNSFDRIAQKYDKWFDQHINVWRSEVLALKEFVPTGKEGLEIGVGTGRFAAELGVQHGIDPAPNMAKIAKSRGIDVMDGFGGNLPYDSNRFDFVLMVTVDCFVEDIEAIYKEAFRVLKPWGHHYRFIG